MPSVSDFAPDVTATGLAYNKVVLGTGQPAATQPPAVARRNAAQAEAEAAKAAADDTQFMRDAQMAALLGDDSIMLPYQPTPSINPPRPRTLAAGYDRETQTMRVKFREGAIYAYYEVSPEEWRNFKRVKSPGRAINRTFNAKPYERLS